MNRAETLRLFAQGRDAWNAWAGQMAAAREALKAEGKWNRADDQKLLSKEASNWLHDANVDFSKHTFEPIDGWLSLEGYHFPAFADFQRTNFGGLRLGAAFDLGANFEGANFRGDVWFLGCSVEGTMHFVEANFLAEAIFQQATFHGDVRFDRATFNRAGNFFAACFLGTSSFEKVIFESTVGFGSSFFAGRASFKNAEFRGQTSTDQASFASRVLFDGAAFHGDGSFAKARFLDNVSFQQCRFDRTADFRDVIFQKAANFQAVEYLGRVQFAGAAFGEVPDFVQAHFAEAPWFDSTKIKPSSSSWRATFGTRGRTEDSAGLAARWRALKRLAIQGHDHEREQAFFKSELLARRWTLDKPWTAVFWAGLCYEVFSDFGRSLFRPICWWIADVVLFASLYLGFHPALSESPGAGLKWMLSRYLPTFGDRPSISCVAGLGDPWWAALHLSLRRALVFAAQDSADKLNYIYACLYGTHANARSMVIPSDLPSTFSPIIPNSVADLGLIQIPFSAAMIFLLLLAVRNRFRIK